jgi:hypothetical protein
MNSQGSVCLLAVVTTLASFGLAQQANQSDSMANCPMHSEHAAKADHHASVITHGEQAMGFSHETTTHHFRISSSGGAVEITANRESDTSDMAAIRSHLSQIRAQFGEGDFSAPMFIHDGIPPGTATMKLLKSKIQYKYEDIPMGARVRIESRDPVAIAAIHDFLRFQIAEHQTGDSVTIPGSH